MWSVQHQPLYRLVSTSRLLAWTWLIPVWHISVWSHFCGLIYVYIRLLDRTETLAGWFPSLCNLICPWATDKRMFWVFAGQQNKTAQHHKSTVAKSFCVATFGGCGETRLYQKVTRGSKTDKTGTKDYKIKQDMTQETWNNNAGSNTGM